MNYLHKFTSIIRVAAPTRSAFLLRQPLRAFSTHDLSSVINNFNARAEAEELSVTGLSKTMHDILKTHISFTDHQEYHPISEELAFYTVKLLSQHKRPFVSFSQARTFLDFGTQFDIQDREYWQVVMGSLQESIQDMKAKDILSIISQLKKFGLLNN